MQLDAPVDHEQSRLVIGLSLRNMSLPPPCFGHVQYLAQLPVQPQL